MPLSPEEQARLDYLTSKYGDSANQGQSMTTVTEQQPEQLRPTFGNNVVGGIVGLGTEYGNRIAGIQQGVLSAIGQIESPYYKYLQEEITANRQIADKYGMGSTGQKIGEFVGDIAGTMPLMALGGTSLPMQVAGSAIGGGLTGYTTPESTTETVDRGLSAAGGTAAGAGGALIGNMIGKGLSKFLPTEAAQQIDGLPMTGGMKTQDPQLQLLEQMAGRGSLGPKAQEAAFGYETSLNEAIKNKVGDLAGRAEPSGINAAAQLQQKIGDEYQAMRSAVSKAYNAAKDQGPAVARSEAIRSGLKDRLYDVFAGGPGVSEFDIDMMPYTKARLADLERIVGDKPSDINALQAWRKRINNSIASTQDNTEKRALGQIKSIYDDFEEQLIDSGMLQGDPAVIDLYKKAIGLRRQQGQRFGRELISGSKDDAMKIVNRIATDEQMTPETVLNLVIGSGDMGKKTNSVNVLRQISKAVGNPEQSNSLFKEAYLSKVLDGAVDTSRLDNMGNPIISPKKMLNEMNALIERNPSLYKELFSTEERAQLKVFRDQLQKVSAKRTGVYSPGSAHDLSALTGKLPLVGSLFGLMDALKRHVSTGKAVNSFAEAFPQAKQPMQRYITGAVSQATVRAPDYSADIPYQANE